MGGTKTEKGDLKILNQTKQQRLKQNKKHMVRLKVLDANVPFSPEIRFLCKRAEEE